MSDVD